MGTSDEDRAETARLLDEAWRARVVVQRFAGYVAFCLLAVGTLPLLIGGPATALRNAAWLVIGSLASGIVLVVGIARLTRDPRFWARVLYWPVRPLVWLSGAAAAGNVVWAAARKTDPHRRAYELLVRVPEWIAHRPDLPEARRWGTPERAPRPARPADPRDEEFPAGS